MVRAAMLAAVAAGGVAGGRAVAVASPPSPEPNHVHIATDPNANPLPVPDPQPMPIADPVAPPPHHPPAAILAVGGIGVAGAKDLHDTAWIARIEAIVFPAFASNEHPGGIVGFGYGFEFWRAGEDNWGFAIPAGAEIGARVGPAHGTIGFGIHALVVDQVNDDTGVGSYSPYASASLGLHVGMTTVVLDGRIDHRFLAGAADRTQWSLGVMIGITEESHPGLYR